MINKFDRFILNKKGKKMVTEGIEPSTVALLAQRSNQLSYATSLLLLNLNKIRIASLIKKYSNIKFKKDKKPLIFFVYNLYKTIYQVIFSLQYRVYGTITFSSRYFHT
jgi:hypothetical protein